MIIWYDTMYAMYVLWYYDIIFAIHSNFILKLHISLNSTAHRIQFIGILSIVCNTNCNNISVIKLQYVHSCESIMQGCLLKEVSQQKCVMGYIEYIERNLLLDWVYLMNQNIYYWWCPRYEFFYNNDFKFCSEVLLVVQ